MHFLHYVKFLLWKNNGKNRPKIKRTNWRNVTNNIANYIVSWPKEKIQTEKLKIINNNAIKDFIKLFQFKIGPFNKTLQVRPTIIVNSSQPLNIWTIPLRRVGWKGGRILQLGLEERAYKRKENVPWYRYTWALGLGVVPGNRSFFHRNECNYQERGNRSKKKRTHLKRS